jgi:hypothetical protein
MNNVASLDSRPLPRSSVPLGPRKVDVLTVSRYTNIAVIERYARDHKVPIGEAAVLFEETKKFLAVCAQTDPAILAEFAPSELQDQMWHTFVLHTRAYMDFCLDHFGVYLHHLPCDGTRTQTDRSRAKKAALEMFGSVAPKYWPIENDADTRCCCSYC